MTKLEKLYSIIEGNMGTGSCFISSTPRPRLREKSTKGNSKLKEM